MTTSELRTLFLDYFKQHGHQIVASSPLVPGNDPTLLFTNAGMVQFKDVFLGQDVRSYKRATTAQRCVRAGGKHNDLENVGYTARHHTFFEMLGNFSFGDYFKREAIQFAWEFLTGVLKLPKERLWVTVYKDDQEAEDIWLKEMKIDPTRFSKCDKDNFWEMGDTGPCGPCSEIFYDHGAHIAGGPPGSPDADGDRYIEIWNLVFMQFNRGADGALTPIPKPCVDTGMGLERISAVVQGVHTNYDIDLFQHLLKAAAQVLNLKDHQVPSLRVIADHIRSAAFLIADSVIPSNEGRGYVLRRIIRRAVRHGNKLGATEPFFYRLVAPLVKEMGEAYPELRDAQKNIEHVLLQEEEQFSRTLDQGLKILEQSISTLKNNIIPGDIVFRLYDTYGFPPDLTGDIARERQLQLDETGFEACMQEQRRQSKAASKFDVDYSKRLESETETTFKGYETLKHVANVTELFHAHEPVKSLKTGEQGLVVLSETPFYAESGGQVGDQGILRQGQAIFVVEDTYKEGTAHVHRGHVTHGEFHVGLSVETIVDEIKRRATMRNHSATHLLHAALRHCLGKHVTQKGSLVAPDRLRFDFVHMQAMTPEELRTVEALVNEKIRENTIVTTDLMAADAAKQAGAMALFGEKYGDEVRVLSMGEFSKELCGGTHVHATGDIGFFKIIAETGIAAGIRRIEAITGEAAVKFIQDLDEQTAKLAKLLNVGRDQLETKASQLMLRIRELEKDQQQLKSKMAQAKGQDFIEQAVAVGDARVLATVIDHADLKMLRETMDRLRQKLNPAIIVLASVEGPDKVNLLASVSTDLIARVKAGDVVNHVARQVGGKGGGRPDMAQAGGNDAAALPTALESVLPWVKEQLKVG